MSFHHILRELDSGALASVADALLRLLDGAEAGPAGAFPGGAAEQGAAARAYGSGAAADASSAPREYGGSAETLRAALAAAAEETGEARRLAEELEARSDANQRSMTIEEVAELPGTGDADAASFSVSTSGPADFDTERKNRGAGMETSPSGGGVMEQARFDADAISEFFRRDSRRYDSGFGG